MSVDPTLRGDAAYVSWWLNVRHGEWSLALSGGERSSFLSALTSSSTPLEAVLDTGSGYAAFAAFFVVSAGETLTIQVRERILWTVVAEQLEAVGAGLQPAVLISLLLRGMRQPHLFRVRSFVKAILAPPALALGSRRAPVADYYRAAMKAVILAGGYRHPSERRDGARPKPMVEIGGRPILGTS